MQDITYIVDEYFYNNESERLDKQISEATRVEKRLDRILTSEEFDRVVDALESREPSTLRFIDRIFPMF